MDTPPIPTRTRTLIRQIRQHNPDVILLQEVTSESLPILQRALCEEKKAPEVSVQTSEQSKTENPEPSASTHDETPKPIYSLHMGDSWAETIPYFPVMFTRTGLMTDSTVGCQRFPASKMHRAYICVQGKLSSSGLYAAFVTSHLESLKEGAAERKDQLQQIFQLMRDFVSDGHTAVFAGDTNLRETEVPAKDVYKTLAAERARSDDGGERPKKRRRVEGGKFVDAWLAAGGVEEHKFTWDMAKNDNLPFGAEFKPKARYDRAFLLWPKDVRVTVDDVRLLGKERLACGKFISDHWGLRIDLTFTGQPGK